MKLKLTGGINGPGLRLSVTAKIAVALSLLISFLMSAVGISVFLRDQALFKKEVQEKGWNIVHTALQFTGNYLQIGNMEFLNNLVKKIATYQDISYVMVLDAGGKVLAHSDEKQVGKKIEDDDAKNALGARADVLRIRYNENGKPVLMDFYSPIDTAGGSTLGYFRLGVDLSGLNRHTRETITNIIMICLAAVLAGICLAALISKRILQKPLQDLTAATEKLATGDFSCKVPVRKRDELGDLATAFNTMTVHLGNLIQSVKSSAADINRAAEQILGRIQTSDRTNDRLSQVLDLLKQGTTEQVAILKQSVDLSEQLSEQSKHAIDCILQILSEVNKTAQTGEKGVSAIARTAASLEQSSHSLEKTRDSLSNWKTKACNSARPLNFLATCWIKTPPAPSR